MLFIHLTKTMMEIDLLTALFSQHWGIDIVFEQYLDLDVRIIFAVRGVSRTLRELVCTEHMCERALVHRFRGPMELFEKGDQDTDVAAKLRTLVLESDRGGPCRRFDRSALLADLQHLVEDNTTSFAVPRSWTFFAWQLFDDADVMLAAVAISPWAAVRFSQRLCANDAFARSAIAIGGRLVRGLLSYNLKRFVAEKGKVEFN